MERGFACDYEDAIGLAMLEEQGGAGERVQTARTGS